MSVRAHIQTEVGKAGDVAHQIRELSGVTEADDVTGPYDVVAKAEADDMDELGKMVLLEGTDDRGHHPYPDLPGGEPLARQAASAAAALHPCAWPLRRSAAALRFPSHRRRSRTA